MEAEQVVRALGVLRDAAASALRDQTGGANVCQLHRDGRVSGGMKYHEGRLVALEQVLRQLRRMPLADGSAGMALLDAHETQWNMQLARYNAAERPALAWVAYSQGGVDALADARGVLHALASPTRAE